MAQGGRIKNWEKTKDTSKLMRWEHTGKDEAVIVDKTRSGTWRIRIVKDGRLIGRGYRTSKKKARKTAVGWMRNHPHGA